MPEKVEEILRAIHVMFSKGEMYHESPDKVILSKREMFALLEQLNYAVVEVMDRYEATNRSKQKALQEMEAAGNRIIDAANKEAEDIYAASILYTDGALNEFTNIVDNTRQRLRDEYAYFEECMNQQLEMVKNNQSELLERLQMLAQNKKYLDIINEFATGQEEKEPDVFAVKETKKSSEGKSKKKEIPSDTVIPEKFKKNAKGTAEQERTQARKSALPEIEEEEWDDTPVRQKVEVKVHTGGGIPENSIFIGNHAKTKRERDREEKYGKTKNGGEEIQLNPEDIEVLEEEVFFTSEQLDAEYEQWESEQQGEQPEGERQEKGLGSFFNRLKTKKQ